MKRFLVASALFALTLVAPAGAKEFVSMSVCGSNGCHTTRDHRALADAMDGEPQADPGQTGAFYKLRTAMGEPGQHGSFGHFTSWWMPSVGVIRGDDGPLGGFTLPRPTTKAVLLRLSRGLHPFPASKLPPAPGQAQDARVNEVVPAPPAGGSGHGDGDGGGGGSAW